MTTPSIPEPTRALPERPSLIQLKKQAKDLLRDYRAGESDVVAEVERFERRAGSVSFRLNDAQRVIARTHGYPSWVALKKHVDSLDTQRLHEAARQGDLMLVEVLLSRGADPNLAGERWATPLAWAKKAGCDDIAELLRDHGAMG